jgi:FtsH-binding integral membrane protein
MAFAQARSNRVIPGAVATLGVSDRVAFLRRTYAHLGVALIAWAALTAIIFRTEFSQKFAFAVLSRGGGWMWLGVLLAFMVVGYIAQRLAMSQASRGLQYLGLGIFVVAEAILLQPLIWVAYIKFGTSSTTSPEAIIAQAAVITMAIFAGLTLTVFVTKKDFSFMRGALMIGTFAALGVILASMIFGFTLGALFAGVMILLMAGYILYQTSLIMREFPPQYHVAAALMLFSTIATLFWYVLQLLMSLRSD